MILGETTFLIFFTGCGDGKEGLGEGERERGEDDNFLEVGLGEGERGKGERGKGERDLILLGDIETVFWESKEPLDIRGDRRGEGVLESLRVNSGPKSSSGLISGEEIEIFLDGLGDIIGERMGDTFNFENSLVNKSIDDPDDLDFEREEEEGDRERE